MRSEIDPSNPVTVHGPIFDGRHEGLLRTGTAAEWMERWVHSHRAQVAIRAADGTVWHLRRVD